MCWSVSVCVWGWMEGQNCQCPASEVGHYKQEQWGQITADKVDLYWRDKLFALMLKPDTQRHAVNKPWASWFSAGWCVCRCWDRALATGWVQPQTGPARPSWSAGLRSAAATAAGSACACASHSETEPGSAPSVRSRLEGNNQISFT